MERLRLDRQLKLQAAMRKFYIYSQMSKGGTPYPSEVGNRMRRERWEDYENSHERTIGFKLDLKATYAFRTGVRTNSVWQRGWRWNT